MTDQYCCEDFKGLLEDGFIEEDKGQLRSNGCFEREKYLIHSHDELTTSIDMYIKFCPRCGKYISGPNYKYYNYYNLPQNTNNKTYDGRLIDGT